MRKNPKKLTDKQKDFLHKYGRQCSKCGEYTVSGSVSKIGKEVVLKSICDNCGHVWKL